MTQPSTPTVSPTPEPGTGSRGLLDVLPAGVVVLDAAGRVADVNDTAGELLGEPLLGQAWDDVLRRATGTDTEPQGDLNLADGRALRIVRREIPGGAGRILLISDITSQRKLEEVLARHRRLANLGEMAATLAHQIRTPLSAALLYASNASNAALPADRRQDLLGKAVDCLHDLEFLVGDMLRFARGAGTPAEAAVLTDVLAGVQRAATALLRPGQRLQVAPPPAELRLTGNREALQGALLNLVSNALQAAGPAARVTVTAEAGSGTADITVADNGPGVPAPLRRRIFDPFFTTRASGTGLGLAVVRSVAEAAGGQVQVEDAPAGGARFILRLPLASAPGALPAAGSHTVAA